MSDKQLENGTEMEETKEKEVEESMEDKPKSPENLPGSPHPDTDDDDDEEELPFPGFVARTLFMTQDNRIRFWCLRAITHPYPF